ncbi:uncharacterized protein LOC132933528 [Metopolophium dirhodum]|uniref:uncharacterized protein LOC132933528 n=1 Tax=Metopolophium dirhodum TaxID=44670 RepID=UPI00299049F4|nr:uncharacterized protein LOC132933528 [Metopolophium dirhodum]
MTSNNEKVDMLLVYGECRRNSRNAARLYAERYPERYHPPHNYFVRIESSLRNSGELPGRQGDNRRNQRQLIGQANEQDKLQVLAYVQLNPRSSIRRLSNEIGISYKKVQDGAPAHNAIVVREYLQNQFGNRWMGTYGAVAWPPRSPDLTPLDFFLWGHLKNEVYSTPPLSIQDLKNKIVIACAELKKEQILAATQREVIRRFQSCMENDGQNFEQFIR